MASDEGWQDILAITSKGQEAQEFPLHADVLQVGRSSDNDIVLDDPLTSRHHARLERQKSGWTISDLNSFNGTFVNGVRIRTPWPLRYGSRIKVGDTMMVFRRQRVKADAEVAPLDERRTALAQRTRELQHELDKLVPDVVEDARSEADSLRQRFNEYDELLAVGATDQADRLLADVQAGTGELDKRMPILRKQSQQAQKMMATHKVMSQLLAEVNDGLVELGREGTDELRRARNRIRRRLNNSKKAYEARDFQKAQVLVNQEIVQKEIDKLSQAAVALQPDLQKKEDARKLVQKRLKRLTGQLNIAREELIALAKQGVDDTRRTDSDEKVREEMVQRLVKLRDPIDTLDIALKAARALPDFTLPKERQARAAVRSFKRAKKLLDQDRVKEAKSNLDEVDEKQVWEWHKTLRAKLAKME